MPDTSEKQPSVEPLTLKDPASAALLAFLIPGLGHLYQGRTAKAVLFFVCIMGTFVYGLYLGSGPEVGWGRVVYWAWQPSDKRLYYFCQVGVGLPAMPAIVQSIRARHGREPFGQFMAPPRIENDPNAAPGGITLSELNRQLGRYFELGTIYTAIAGLLNLLAVFDAWAGPFVPHPEQEKVDKEGRQDKKEEEDEEGRSRGMRRAPDQLTHRSADFAGENTLS